MDNTSRKINNEAWLICPNWTEVRRFVKNKNNKDWVGFLGNFPSYICIKGK